MESKNEWEFPERLEAFRPYYGSLLHKVFEDLLALLFYAQYRRRHIVDRQMSVFLTSFPLAVANEVRAVKEKSGGIVTVEQVVEVWDRNWRGVRFTRDETKEKWAAMIEPLMPFINGKKTIKLVEEDGKFFIVSEVIG